MGGGQIGVGHFAGGHYGHGGGRYAGGSGMDMVTVVATAARFK
jgi:hypothetical protein